MASERRSRNGSKPKVEAHKNGLQVGGYRVVRELETDSLGVIYEAEHPRMQRRVALRTIEPAVARDVSFSRRFLLRPRLYGPPQHPALPPLFELPHSRGSPFPLAQMIPRQKLGEEFRSGGPFYAPRGI